MPFVDCSTALDVFVAAIQRVPSRYRRDDPRACTSNLAPRTPAPDATTDAFSDRGLRTK